MSVDLIKCHKLICSNARLLGDSFRYVQLGNLIPTRVRNQAEVKLW